MTNEMLDKMANHLESDEVLIFVRGVNTDHSNIYARGQLNDVILAATKTIIGAGYEADRMPFVWINAAIIIFAHIWSLYATDDEKNMVPVFSFKGGKANEEALQSTFHA